MVPGKKNYADGNAWHASLVCGIGALQWPEQNEPTPDRFVTSSIGPQAFTSFCVPSVSEAILKTARLLPVVALMFAHATLLPHNAQA